MLLLYCIPVAVVLGILVESFPDILGSLPGGQYMSDVQLFAQVHSVAVATACIVFVVLFLFVGLTAAIMTNWMHRRAIKKEYEYEPEEYEPESEQGRAVGTRSECAGCGYNLTGNVSGRCPECGRPINPQD